MAIKGGLHMLRHLHASILLSNNIDLKTIQSQLRHQNIDTTNKYLHELKNDIRESIKRFTFLMQYNCSNYICKARYYLNN